MPLAAVILRKSKARQMPSARKASIRSIFMVFTPSPGGGSAVSPLARGHEMRPIAGAGSDLGDCNAVARARRSALDTSGGGDLELLLDEFEAQLGRTQLPGLQSCALVQAETCPIREPQGEAVFGSQLRIAHGHAGEPLRKILGTLNDFFVFTHSAPAGRRGNDRAGIGCVELPALASYCHAVTEAHTQQRR